MVRKLIAEHTTNSPVQTQNFGAVFAESLSAGDVACFTGDLGSGKTTCIKGLCSGLGVTAHVTSPTFTLINEYNGKFPVYHFDFYRLSTSEELGDLGLNEYFYGDGICLIEWPAVAMKLLPDHRYEIEMSWNFAELAETDRQIKVFKTTGSE